MNESEENRSIYGTEQLSWIGKYGELKKERNYGSSTQIEKYFVIRFCNIKIAHMLHSNGFIVFYSIVDGYIRVHTFRDIVQFLLHVWDNATWTHTHTFTLFKRIRFRKKFQEIERKTTLKKIKLNSIKVIFALNLENDAHTRRMTMWKKSVWCVIEHGMRAKSRNFVCRTRDK